MNDPRLSKPSELDFYQNIIKNVPNDKDGLRTLLAAAAGYVWARKKRD
jgi:hypothetical protein